MHKHHTFMVSTVDLTFCKALLVVTTVQTVYFWLKVVSLYTALLISGKRFQTFNLHQLLHLKNNVENLGPLWSNSCFPFEDYNGDLKGYFHGSQNIQGQVRKILQQWVAEWLTLFCSSVSYCTLLEKLDHKFTTSDLVKAARQQLYITADYCY